MALRSPLGSQLAIPAVTCGNDHLITTLYHHRANYRRLKQQHGDAFDATRRIVLQVLSPHGHPDWLNTITTDKLFEAA